MELTEPTAWSDDRLELGEGARWVDDRLVLVDLLAGRLLTTDAARPAPLAELLRLDVPWARSRRWRDGRGSGSPRPAPASSA